MQKETFLGNLTESEGLIELGWWCGTPLQWANAKELYLEIPETQEKVHLILEA